MKKCFSVIIAVCSLFLAACSNENNVDGLVQETDLKHVLSSAEEAWIEELSPKRIGRLSPIVIRFTRDFTEQNIGDAVTVVSDGEGVLQAIDTRTIEFVPSEAYEANEKIAVSVSLQDLFEDTTEDDLEGITDGLLKVDFFADYPSYSVDFDGISLDVDGNYVLAGTLHTDIPLPYKDIDKVVTAKLLQGSKTSNEKVVWDEDGSTDSRVFSVIIDTKASEERSLLISWEGTSLGISREADAGFSGSRSFFVPKEGAFEITNIDTSSKDFVSIDFSEPLESSQDLRGFFTVQTRAGSVSTERVRYQINGNNVTIYNEDGFENAIAFTVNKGIASSSGKTLAENTSVALSDDWEIPTVRFPSAEGAILPTTQGSTLTIETKNLTGVIVQAFHISGDSITQFLQVNDLHDDYELDRVGEPVWTKTFDVSWDASMQNKFITHGLDLSELVKNYPDGMFQLRVTFRQRHTMYKCTEDHEDFSHLEMPSDTEIITHSSHTPYWNSNYTYRNTYSYRNDPCHPNFYFYSYYNSSIAMRNVLVSDIGVMAKKTSDDRWYITASNLQTTEPIANLAVEVYSYIGKIVAEGKTDNEGGVILSTENPSYIAVHSDSQSSYLKLSTENALNTSHFDVGGEKPIDGVKGFIYGERGVWRPGDDIYLTFVLDDTFKQFPQGFPITFELSDPSGKITESKIIQAPVDGFYAIKTQTHEDAKTGNWTATVKAGGQQWTKNIKVETIVPNRLSINLDIGGEYLKRTNSNVTFTGAWLHGAPTPNYKADISAVFYNAPTEFVGYNDYVFTNLERSIPTGMHELWEGTLNANSQAIFSLMFDDQSDYPGKMTVQMVSKLHEPTGLFSTEQALFDFEPYETYVGLKVPQGSGWRGSLVTDTDHTAEVVVVNPEGNEAPRTTLEYTIHELEWKWWWERDALTEASYVGSRYNRRVDAGTFTTNSGKGNFNFNIESEERGRYLISVTDVNGGHSASKIVYINPYGWAGGSTGEDTDSASMLSISKDKESYLSGETAVITFPSNKDGKALITVEKDGAVITQEWIETKEEVTSYNVKLTRENTPNIYVHVSLIQPHLQTANSLPIRMYGIVPVLVEDPMSRLEPVIAMDDSFEPSKEASVTVSEKSGRAMTFTLAVVEEGLLGLTRFETENPWDEFYKKEASRLLSWDIYDSVINAYSGILETLLTIGGAETILENPENANRRFEPVVKYFGPYELPANGEREIRFDMPEYVGSVRAMVVAGRDGAYGIAESTVPVKSDLMVLPSLPRTLGTDESLEVPVTVFNGTDTNQTVDVHFQSKGVVELSARSSVEVGARGEGNVMFTLNSTEEGWSDITVTATMKDASASTTTTIETVAKGIPVFSTEKTILETGEEETFTLELTADPSSLDFSVELSSLPPIDLSSRLSYLVRYPHGCLEQIISAGFPQLYVSDFVNSNEDEIEDIKKNVQSVIDKLSSYQTTSGGFAYWMGRTTPHGWGSNYAGHFMIEAKNAGYTVPDSVYVPWLRWQKLQAGQWTQSSVQSAQTQAYRLYTLALAGEEDIGAMNRLNALDYDGSVETLMLAASYAVSGHRDTAENVLEDLSENIAEYRETGGNFGSTTRDIAMRLYVHNLLGETRKLARDIEEVSDKLSSNGYMSTQSIAWSFIALLPYYNGMDYEKISYDLVQNGTLVSDDFTGGSTTVELVPSSTTTHTVRVKNTGSIPLYAKALVEGVSVPGSELRKNSDLLLNVQYYTDTGAPTNPLNFDIGDNFSITLSVENLDSLYDIENIALTLPIPTGWEVFNERLASSDESISSAFDYQDIRDEAIYTYFSLDSLERKEFSFSGTVTHAGEYNIPAVHAEAMYDDSYSAVYPGVNATR